MNFSWECINIPAIDVPESSIKRNIEWVNILSKKIKELDGHIPPQTSLVIVIGTGHLIGETSVIINLMKALNIKKLERYSSLRKWITESSIDNYISND